MNYVKSPAATSIGGSPMANKPPQATSSVADFAQIHMRWLIHSDMPQVLKIERDGYEEPWTEEEFKECLSQRNCIGKVAEYRGAVIGFIIYELHSRCLLLLNLAVAGEMQEQGVARLMVDHLKSGMARNRRTRLIHRLTERDVRGQVVLRSLGFRWTKTLTRQTDDGSDIYQMEYRLDDQADVPEQEDYEHAD